MRGSQEEKVGDKERQRRHVVLLRRCFLFFLLPEEGSPRSSPIQRRVAASSAGAAVPSRTRRLITSIFASSLAFRPSFSFASSASLTVLSFASSSSRLRQEELHSRRVQGVTTSQDPLCEERRCGSHVTDRDCHTLRLGHLNERRRPRPRRRSLLSPKGVVRLADLPLSATS